MVSLVKLDFNPGTDTWGREEVVLTMSYSPITIDYKTS